MFMCLFITSLKIFELFLSSINHWVQVRFPTIPQRIVIHMVLRERGCVVSFFPDPCTMLYWPRGSLAIILSMFALPPPPPRSYSAQWGHNKHALDWKMFLFSTKSYLMADIGIGNELFWTSYLAFWHGKYVLRRTNGLYFLFFPLQRTNIFASN